MPKWRHLRRQDVDQRCAQLLLFVPVGLFGLAVRDSRAQRLRHWAVPARRDVSTPHAGQLHLRLLFRLPRRQMRSRRPLRFASVQERRPVHFVIRLLPLHLRSGIHRCDLRRRHRRVQTQPVRSRPLCQHARIIQVHINHLFVLLIFSRRRHDCQMITELTRQELRRKFFLYFRPVTGTDCHSFPPDDRLFISQCGSH